MQQVYESTGILPPELKITLPESYKYLWFWFLELHSARQNNGFGVSALSYTEIKAWIDLSGIVIASWEIVAIRAIDKAYIDYVAKADKKDG